ncbi:hypothetical protein N7528_003403 [Penicillium herquei]|nr:hypothetical protein N7528_003403 [Penicillium herquei]
MDSQDGITVRSMRLKVLYTFDNESKTNCLARWPHVLDIQTAYLDETTAVGVIELKTCIQAIVSASPELVAQLGKDYTVYAYDYSEYETPLVGQGMLSWVLASASPTPEAPAHQSKTMVTGRVCKNPLGLFSKGAGAQETLEVKLRLVPVPTVMQSQYLDSMQKYRDLSNVIPHDFDAQSWTNFVRQNPGLLEASRSQAQDRGNASSPMGGSGIERFHQILSEGATPREFSGYDRNESVRSVSPAQSFAANSRVSTPGGAYNQAQHSQPQSRQHQYNQSSDMIRPSSSASMRENDFQMQQCHSRRDSIQSGYASGGEDIDPQPRKRAKLYQAGWPGKSDMNIERQPSSLRVAASTAASVRIHRPTPVNPSIAAEQSHEEPVRPPTPIMRPGNGPRRQRPQSSALRESSVVSSYTSPYMNSDDIHTDPAGHSPEESRYQGLFEPPFTMPSSPPVISARFPPKSSPVLPPLTIDTDSGFMSGGLEDLLDDEGNTPVGNGPRAGSYDPDGANPSHSVRSAVQANSPTTSAVGTPADNSHESRPMSAAPTDQTSRPSLPPQRRPGSSAGSRPNSRNGVRLAPKPLMPVPPIDIRPIPASDPVAPVHPQRHAQNSPQPMSDVVLVEQSSRVVTPIAQLAHPMPQLTHPMPQPINSSPKTKPRSAKRRAKQIQERLDSAIKAGQVPPFCDNCGCIETPTWRRAWMKDFDGGEDYAKQMLQETGVLFYLALERDSQERITKFKMYKKTPQNWDDAEQVLLCNPCGLWLYKFKIMRPEQKWKGNDGTAQRKRRPVRNRRTGGPLSNPSTMTRSMVASSVTAASSPAPTEASSVQPEEGATPQVDTPQVDSNPDQGAEHYQGQDVEADEPPSKRRRANSAEPPRSTESSKTRWEHDDALEALQRAIQSSPARNMAARKVATAEGALTPKPLRRALFPPPSQNDSPLKELDPSMMRNAASPRRSPRIASREDKHVGEKENQEPTDGLDDLFESPSIDPDMPVSPTPRRRLPGRLNGVLHERRHSLPCNSPTGNRRRDVGSATASTRLTAERLQRIQEDQDQPHTSPRQSNGGLQSTSFDSIDGMILDIFDETSVQPDFFQLGGSKSAEQNWADWLPTDYVSPNDSEDNGGPHDDLISAILSDPTVLKENLHNSAFNPFGFADQLPDSGFFSSDNLHNDSMGPLKSRSVNEQSNEQQQASPAA